MFALDRCPAAQITKNTVSSGNICVFLFTRDSDTSSCRAHRFCNSCSVVEGRLQKTGRRAPGYSRTSPGPTNCPILAANRRTGPRATRLMTASAVWAVAGSMGNTPVFGIRCVTLVNAKPGYSKQKPENPEAAWLREADSRACDGNVDFRQSKEEAEL